MLYVDPLIFDIEGNTYARRRVRKDGRLYKGRLENRRNLKERAGSLDRDV